MENLEFFQQTMKLYNMDAYIVPTGDYHNSEYVGDYFKAREFLSGFTGSAGTLVVTKDHAYLWTDGRYFIQAAKELEGKPIDLMKMDEDISLEDFLVDYMKDKKTLAFDGKVMPANIVENLKERLKNVTFVYDIDLINQVWKQRPKLPFSLIYKLDTFFSGKTFEEKLTEIRNIMKKENVEYHILTSLEDQAWLYNLRGNDVSHTPVFLA
nr:aminopeptidase P family N-terminal domain-containing protein [Acholeplasmatales bacterium]